METRKEYIKPNMESLNYLSTDDLMAGWGVGDGSTPDQYGKGQELTNEVATPDNEDSYTSSVWDE